VIAFAEPNQSPLPSSFNPPLQPVGGLQERRSCTLAASKSRISPAGQPDVMELSSEVLFTGISPRYKAHVEELLGVYTKVHNSPFISLLHQPLSLNTFELFIGMKVRTATSSVISQFLKHSGMGFEVLNGRYGEYHQTAS